MAIYQQMHMKGLNGILVFCLLLGVALQASAATENETADAVVDRLHSTLLDVMRTGEKLGYDGRLDHLAPVIHSSFDFQTIARIVIGRHWKQLSEQQKANFLDVFSQLSTATYAARFDTFNGESFRLVGTEPQKRDHVLVKTELLKNDGKTIALSYRVRPTDDGHWLIINVIAEGVSDLSLKRSDYSAVIRDRGFDELLTRLKNKISDYQSGGAAD